MRPPDGQRNHEHGNGDQGDADGVACAIHRILMAGGILPDPFVPTFSQHGVSLAMLFFRQLWRMRWHRARHARAAAETRGPAATETAAFVLQKAARP